MDEVFEMTYHNPEIQRLLKIYKRTHRSRIKLKLFKRIFGLCLDEKKVIVLSDVVIMKPYIYEYLISTTNTSATVTDKSGETMALMMHGV